MSLFVDFLNFFKFFKKYLRVNPTTCHVLPSIFNIQFGLYIHYFCSI